jgi:GTP-binding protein Era
MEGTSVQNGAATESVPHRAGYVSILGRPNVGKSTFLNQVLGVKLSIISPKPQTTRHRILGIHSGDHFQIVFLDTPGLLEPKYLLQEVMMKAVDAAVEDANVILYMVEAADHLDPDDRPFLERIKKNNKPLLVLINKIDLVRKGRILPQIDEIAREFQPEEIIPISALERDGLDEVIQEIVRRLPENPPFYPPDMLTEHPERFIVGEIIREKIFLLFGEEIPYSTTVTIDEFRERPGEKDYIRATIFVEKDSQKGILIGKKGQALKKVGTLAREEIEYFLGRPVYLELWVKVKENWRRDAGALRHFGYGPQLPRL